MNHLTEDQLTALLDGAQAAAERAACDAHLAACDACRAKLAELASLDDALTASLAHDPGEAYFATFADRVGARIATKDGTHAPATSPRRPPRAWWLSPRGLSLVGGAAALLVTAGIAWMRFRGQDDVARALRTEAPSPVGAALREREATAPSAGDTAPPATSTTQPDAGDMPPAAGSAPASRKGLEPPLGVRADAGSLRAREVRPPAGDPSAPAAPKELTSSATDDAARDASAESAPAPSAIAQMKRRALAPAGEAPPKAGEDAAAKPGAIAPVETADRLGQGGATQTFAAPPKDANAPEPVPAPVLQHEGFRTGRVSSLSKQNESRLRSERSAETGLKLEARSPLAVQCGKVADSRGTPLRGAQITLLGARTRSTRSASDGTFCLDSARAGDTLGILHVGFEPLRVVLGSSTTLAFELEPVGTLGPRGGLLLGGRGERALRVPSATEGDAPPPDVYSWESESILAEVAEARAASTAALRTRSAESHEQAALRWEGIGARTSGRASFDARFRFVGELREAYRTAPTPARLGRLRSALGAFLAGAPRTLPERATVLRWQAELGAPAPR